MSWEQPDAIITGNVLASRWWGFFQRIEKRSQPIISFLPALVEALPPVRFFGVSSGLGKL